jgi:3-dehydroquinate dehydratase
MAVTDAVLIREVRRRQWIKITLFLLDLTRRLKRMHSMVLMHLWSINLSKCGKIERCVAFLLRNTAIFSRTQESINTGQDYTTASLATHK